MFIYDSGTQYWIRWMWRLMEWCLNTHYKYTPIPLTSFLNHSTLTSFSNEKANLYIFSFFFPPLETYFSHHAFIRHQQQLPFIIHHNFVVNFCFIINNIFCATIRRRRNLKKLENQNFTQEKLLQKSRKITRWN